MTDSDDKYEISDQDKKLWLDYVGEAVEPAEQENFADLLKTHEADEGGVDEVVGDCQQPEPLKDVQPAKSSFKQHGGDYQLDKRTEEKLKKGKMPIEARLDLHGLSRTQAHESLQGFLSACFDKDLRCVLVITGKGKAKATSADWLTPSKGILKEHVPIWLNEGFLKKIVLKQVTAQPKDGGSGALYVYLRRNK